MINDPLCFTIFENLTLEVHCNVRVQVRIVGGNVVRQKYLTRNINNNEIIILCITMFSSSNLTFLDL